MKSSAFTLLCAALALCAAQAFAAAPKMSTVGIAFEEDDDATSAGVDEFGRPYLVVEGDTIHAAYLPGVVVKSTKPLDDADYREVADSLGVEAAAIKAVVSIETGRVHRGFYAEGKPIINFDLNVYRNQAAKRGINLAKYSKSHSVIFSRPNIAKYGTQQRAQQARLDAAMTIDSISAIYGTFWGMFQIGGFNWKRCGADSPAHFVEKMCASEREQLEMFATFIKNAGLLDALRRKDWARFARGYNGPSYAAQNYHTKMADAYARYKKELG